MYVRWQKYENDTNCLAGQWVNVKVIFDFVAKEEGTLVFYKHLLFVIYWSTSNYQTTAVIGHRRIVWPFYATHENGINFSGGRGVIVNRKIRKKLADDLEIDMLT